MSPGAQRPGSCSGRSPGAARGGAWTRGAPSRSTCTPCSSEERVAESSRYQASTYLTCLQDDSSRAVDHSGRGVRGVWQFSGGLVPDEEPSDGVLKRCNTERLVDRGYILWKGVDSLAPADIVNMKDGQVRKILSHSLDQLGAAQPGHIVVGDDHIERLLGGASCIQRGLPVRNGHDFVPCIAEGTGDQRSNHRLVVDDEDPPGHCRPSAIVVRDGDDPII